MKGWAPQSRAGQDGSGQAGEANGAGQNGQCFTAQGTAGVCACKSVRLREFAKQMCFEFASVADGAASPSSSFGVVLFSPPSFGCCCF